ncbi:MAG: lytic transglycosylase domain-containing protein [Deltaproteobacteria bacterium]|nr:lytic transglycosylase domain-containing protein [Deltaproteobacteria bacterium]
MGKRGCLVGSLLLLIFFWAGGVEADLFVYADPEGNIHVTHSHEKSGEMKLVSRYPSSLPEKENLSESLDRYRRDIEQAAARYGVEEELIRAVIKAESDYDPYAVSVAGAIGLMQLMPETAKKLKVDDPFQPEQNIDGGVRYLRELQKRFGKPRLVIAAYHAGETRVAACGDIPPIPSTRAYVARVLRYYQGYKKMHRPPKKIYKVVQADGGILYTTTPQR